MATRLRKINNTWIALCAVESDKKLGDIYLDDGQQYALACKFANDWGCWTDKRIDKLMLSQKVRDAEIELQKWLDINRKKYSKDTKNIKKKQYKKGVEDELV